MVLVFLYGCFSIYGSSLSLSLLFLSVVLVFFYGCFLSLFQVFIYGYVLPMIFFNYWHNDSCCLNSETGDLASLLNPSAQMLLLLANMVGLLA